jgi:pyruvate kinase
VFLQQQVLDSMVSKDNMPSRLELTDVSNSVLDGADIFILADETAIGARPLESTKLLAKAIMEAENVFNHDQAYQEMRGVLAEKGKKAHPTDILCSTAMSIALDNNVDLFLCITTNGRIAKFLAKQRPMQPILACSVYSNVVRQINSTRGVQGYKIPAYLKRHQSKLLELVLKMAKEQELCYPGNKVMIFSVTDEGKITEGINFKILDIEE